MNLVQNTVPLIHLHPGTLAAMRCHDRATVGPGLQRRADSPALAAFADALQARNGADALAVLRGFEQAAAAAEAEQLHWLAALSFEQAARHAADVGLESARQHYHRQSREHYRQCEARGRKQAPQETACGSGADATSRLCSPKALALSIAHEVNQPMAALALHMGAACRWLRRAEPDIGRALDSLAMAEAANHQASTIVRGMQRLASGDAPELERVPVDEAVGKALHSLRGNRHAHGIVLEQSLALGALCIAANGVQVEQVVTNLVLNAIEAHTRGSVPGARLVHVATRRHGEHEIEIVVSDNGPGIPLARRKDIFTSLVSTKPARTSRAAGMGLSICLSIVRAHGGQLWFEPAKPHGATFRLRLPLDAGQPA